MATGSILAAFLMIGLAAGDRPAPVEASLRSGGRVEMRLEAGDYEIQAGREDRVVVSVQGRHASRMRVTVEGSTDSAVVRVASPHHTEAKAVIQVPATCDLVVRLTAGDLRIGAIHGNKDVRSRAGNLEVKVPDPGEYGQVRASVTVGDLDAPSFHTRTSGLFRSLSWRGEGRNSLRVSLIAGDLVLQP